MPNSTNAIPKGIFCMKNISGDMYFISGFGPYLPFYDERGNWIQTIGPSDIGIVLSAIETQVKPPMKYSGLSAATPK